MALTRRSGARLQSSIWPGFVDAMTGLLLVLMFVLTIFMMVQFVLREEISGQATRLDALSAEVAALSLALGLEQDRSASLENRVGALTATLDDARSREAAQTEALRAAEGRIASFEEQVAGLLSERAIAQGRIADLETSRAELLSEQEQLELALAGLRDEVDAQAEAARLAAARREALEALAADLRQRNTEAAATQAALEQRLSAEEQARLAEAAAAEALRTRLADADAELTAMTLALEEQRKRAEETLTLLAAAETARADLNSQLAQALLDAEQGSAAREADLARLRDELADFRDAAAQSAQEVQAVRDQLVAALAAQRAAETGMTEAEERAALLSEARARLAEEAARASEAQKQQTLLNQQVAALRQQLSGLQALLDESKAREAEAEVQLQSLGNELNTALARVAAEERRRRIAEEERARLLEAEKEDLEKYRSEFFGRLRDVLGQQQGVQIVGDRFVFSSEVLFAPGEADLSSAGQGEIAKVADILRNVIGDIPEGIDWVLQVDGHTDNVPIIEGARFADNWALSQARALSVVRYLTGALGFPAERLSANGYGEFQPVNPENTPAARAQNRRIELKLTTR